MVTRGEVLNTPASGATEVQIKIPMFGLIEEGEGEEQVNELPYARICTVPGCFPNFKQGDTVLICIEDNNLDNVMIMGRLITDDGKVGTSVATFENLTVEKDTVLARNTTIGEVLPENIEHLIGSEYNIQTQFDTNINEQINLINWTWEKLDSITFD